MRATTPAESRDRPKRKIEAEESDAGFVHAAPGPTAKKTTVTDREVGDRVRMRRKELGLSQGKLGEAVGVSFQQIQKYESGANRIGASRLKEISKVLMVPVSFFFEDPLDADAGDATAGLLSKPGAIELLRLYAKIDSAVLAEAVVELARSLARDDHPAAAPKPTSS